MKSIIFTIGLVLLFIIPSVNADLLDPRYKRISIENKITNINDFPDYVFVSVEKYPNGDHYIKLIETDGKIPEAYKLSSHSVYAIKKSGFDEEAIIQKIGNLNESERDEYKKYLQDFFSSSKAKQVITNISTSASVPISSTQEKIFREYIILSVEDQVTPVNNMLNEKVERNNLIYFYIFAPVLALLIIILIILKKRK